MPTGVYIVCCCSKIQNGLTFWYQHNQLSSFTLCLKNAVDDWVNSCWYVVLCVVMCRVACNEKSAHYPVTQCDFADSPMACMGECTTPWNGTSRWLCSLLPLSEWDWLETVATDEIKDADNYWFGSQSQLRDHGIGSSWVRPHWTTFSTCRNCHVWTYVLKYSVLQFIMSPALAWFTVLWQKIRFKLRTRALSTFVPLGKLYYSGGISASQSTWKALINDHKLYCMPILSNLRSSRYNLM